MASKEEELKELAELEELAQLEALAAKESAPAPVEPTMGDRAMQALNYVGGLGRGTVAAGLEPLIGKDIVSPEEIMTGKVPGSAELMERAGVPAGWSLSTAIPAAFSEPGQGGIEKGGMLDITARGFGGLVGDIALDPSTYVLPMVKGAGMAAKGARVALNPLGEAVGLAGKQIAKTGTAAYKSAFEKADRALATRYGKGSIADILKSEKFVGNAEDALKKAEEINQTLGQKIGDYRATADASGLMSAPPSYDEAEKLIQKYRVASDPKMMNIADSLQETLDSYKAMPPKTATELATVKRTNLDMAGGDTAFDKLKSSPDRAESELRRLIAKELGKAEDDVVKASLSKEEFDAYLKTKKDYGITTKFTQKQLAKLAGAEASRTGVLPSAVDVMGTGTALATGSPIGLGTMALKKARDIGRLTGTKTGGGRGLEILGGGIETVSKVVPPQVWLEMIRSKESEK
jgi:hypothetical protein